MEKTTHALLFVLCLFYFSCQQKITGVYRSNFALNGFFIETLSLKCDSTFEYTRRGDIQHLVIKGTWKFANSNVILAVDTTTKLKNAIHERYFYKKKKLMDFSNEDYKNFVARILFLKDSLYIQDTSNEVIDIPEPNKASANMYGKSRIYYLKKIAGGDCNDK